MWTQLARAGPELEVWITRSEYSDKRIDDLEIKVETFRVVRLTSGRTVTPVVLTGKFAKPGWRLNSVINYQSTSVQVDPQGNFKVQLLFNDTANLRDVRNQRFSLSALNPKPAGSNQVEVFDVWLKDKKLSAPMNPRVKTLRDQIHRELNIGVNVTGSRVHYKEKTLYEFTNYAAGLAIDLGYPFYPPAFALGGRVTYHAIAFSSTAEETAKFFSLSGAVSYTLFSAYGNFGFSFNGGASLTQMSAITSAYGFSPVLGIELFPSFKKKFNSGELFGHIKYVPLSATLEIISQEREFSLELGWGTAVDKTKMFLCSLGFRDVLFYPTPGSVIAFQLISVTLGYRF